MIAIIPARGGSKGVPGKNIKDLCGKPLIAYAIESAKQSKYIDKVVVDTDDTEIAEVAKKYGAEIPYLRPAYLAKDTSEAQDVYVHGVEKLMEEYGEHIQKFVVLLPTAPFRRGRHIDEAIELFHEAKAETLVSMTEVEVPVEWYYKKDTFNRVVNAGLGDHESVQNRQKREKYYVPNGAIYILDYDLLKEKRTYYCDNTITYVMSSEDSVDIDTAMDFEIASVLMSKRNME